MKAFNPHVDSFDVEWYVEYKFAKDSIYDRPRVAIVILPGADKQSLTDVADAVIEQEVAPGGQVFIVSAHTRKFF